MAVVERKIPRNTPTPAALRLELQRFRQTCRTDTRTSQYWRFDREGCRLETGCQAADPPRGTANGTRRKASSRHNSRNRSAGQTDSKRARPGPPITVYEPDAPTRIGQGGRHQRRRLIYQEGEAEPVNLDEAVAAVVVAEMTSRELDDDYVELCSIPWRLHRQLAASPDAKIRELSEAVLRGLVQLGVSIGDLDGNSGVFTPWSSNDCVERVKRELITLGREPNIGDIAWLTR